MQTSLKKLALTGSVAALLLAMPVSIDLGRSGATDATFKIAGIGLTIDSAQARVGHPATPGSVAGVSRRTTRRTVARTTPAVRPGYVRPVAGASSPAPLSRWERPSRCCRRNAPPSWLTASRIAAAGRPIIARRAARMWW